MNDATKQHAAWTPEGEVPPPLSETILIDAIATVYDPEIPVNIYELGLIYAVDIPAPRNCPSRCARR
jgi:metal-sulfur cluster biosynthetic enzyme